ncbi:MAG: hypothetical protein R3B72_21465 [Polyangiaceae bacterium]
MRIEQAMEFERDVGAMSPRVVALFLESIAWKPWTVAVRRGSTTSGRDAVLLCGRRRARR